MIRLTALLKPVNGRIEQDGTLSVISDPVIFSREDHEARELEERLNNAATGFYLTITSGDQKIRERAYADLSTQDPRTVAGAFIVVMRRTDGFDRINWGVEFVNMMAREYARHCDRETSEEFGKAMAEGLLDESLGIPDGIADALTRASLSHVRVDFGDIPPGASYDLGLRAREKSPAETS